MKKTLLTASAVLALSTSGVLAQQASPQKPGTGATPGQTEISPVEAEPHMQTTTGTVRDRTTATTSPEAGERSNNPQAGNTGTPTGMGGTATTGTNR